MAQSKSRRSKRRTKKSKAKSKRGPKRKTRTKAKRAKRGASRKTSSARKKKGKGKRKRTTAQGMKRAMRLKEKSEEQHAGEERLYGQEEKPNWPTQMPSSVIEPESVPENIREQGDTANIIQNTSNRRAG
ncbi:MAG TPA: hypothetical protein VHD34_00020 [Xanthobacteraceae bacterium]|nr:hypothetical protein [Xanthobacteraceae bacterium]